MRAAAERLPAGAELVLFDRIAEIPPYSEDAEWDPAPEAVVALRDAIGSADAVLIATPEYNHSLPGQLKNALDWASRPAGQSSLNGKPAAGIGASKSMFGAVWAQAELRKVLAAMGGRVLETDLPVARAHELVTDDRMRLPAELGRRLDEILAELLDAAEQERSTRAERQPLAA
jgi:chromate reductase